MRTCFYLDRRTCFLLRQENMRTRGRVKAWLSKKRTWGLVGLCPTLVACVSSLKPLDFSLFTLHSSLLNIKTREHENKREGWRLDWAKREHEAGLGFAQHSMLAVSARFLPTFVGIHEFCPTYVCAKYWEKHWHEWLMHVLGHLREQKLHAFGAFSQAWHRWRGVFTEVVFDICHVWWFVKLLIVSL